MWARTYSDHIRSIVGKKPDNLRDLFTLSSIYMPFVHFVLFADYVVVAVAGFDFGVVGFKHSTHTHILKVETVQCKGDQRNCSFSKFHIVFTLEFCAVSPFLALVLSLSLQCISEMKRMNNERRKKIACETETHIENSLCSGFKMWPLVCAFFSLYFSFFISVYLLFRFPWISISFSGSCETFISALLVLPMSFFSCRCFCCYLP